MNTTSYQLLTEARNILLTDGWCQGQYHSVNGAHCLTGALFEARKNISDVLPVYAALRRVIGTNGFTLVDWNDTKGRTKERVIEAFNQAIALIGGYWCGYGSRW